MSSSTGKEKRQDVVAVEEDSNLHSFVCEPIKLLPMPAANTFVSNYRPKGNMADIIGNRKRFDSPITSKNKDLSSQYSSQATEPKVSLPYKTLPGHPPRIIEIQRKKRLYASADITDLLHQRGIDYCSPGDPVLQPWCTLPLSAFDNCDYDVFPDPASWMILGIKDGMQLGLPAKGMLRDEEGVGSWVDIRVVAYDSATARVYQISIVYPYIYIHNTLYSF